MMGAIGLSELLMLGSLQLLAIVALIRTYQAYRANLRISWGRGVSLLLFLAVTWDAIPTWIAFEYHAQKEAGFAVFKSLEQWKKENPGVAETLEPYEFKDKRAYFTNLGGNKFLHPLNARFAYTDQHFDELFLSVYAHRYTVLDITKNEVLMSYVEVGSGNNGGFARGGAGWWAFWLIHEPAKAGFNEFFKFVETAKNISVTK